MSKVEKDGGRNQFGWKVLDKPDGAVIARFNAIWISTEGVCFDITPDPIATNKNLFLVDALPSLCISI